ncbi:CPBP family intramembrane metalloprotease [Rhodobacterales bacterium HKCCE3408]|nr:CPBP family intramembrane metalloprotease [Rhodobacterales bacterium HKCCE3408]
MAPKVRPSLQIGIAVYIAYLLIVIGAMWAGGANYMTMTAPDQIFINIVVPLLLGAVLLVGVISWFGWWTPVMRDRSRASPEWLFWPIVFIAIAFIGINLSAADWSNIAAAHLIWLVAAGILVGFNEEALTRGVLLVGFREGGRSETFVAITSSFLFGLLHLPNALLGLPLYGAAIQVVFAGIMGLAFYTVRRTTGLLVIPMIIHGLWDFASFSRASSGAEPHSMQTVLQFSAYAVAIVCAVTLLWKSRGNTTHNEF